MAAAAAEREFHEQQRVFCVWRGGQDWAANSPDMSPMDQTSHVLIQRKMVKASFCNMKKRAGKLILVDGGHFEGRKL